MTINRKICPPGLKNNPNRTMKSIGYITIHNTGNYTTSAGAQSHANYLYGGSGGKQTSWHYSVDKNEIWQSFEDTQECWHAGDGSGSGNTASIGIEICVNDKNGFIQACDRAAWLTAELLKRHSLGIDKVVQHNKWSGKNCPADLRSGAWGVTWEDFLAMVSQYCASSSDKPIIDMPTAAAAEMPVNLTLVIDSNVIGIETAENINGRWYAPWAELDGKMFCIRDTLVAAGYGVTWEESSKTIIAAK